MTKIVSIQSSVAYGHVGNSAATFPLMRMQCEVLPVLTVHFAASTIYGPPAGPMLTPEQVGDVIAGLDDLDVLRDVDAVLSGFQGAPAMGARILESVSLVKERNPRALYCCDPVMGDVGRGMYALPGIPEFMRERVIAAADIATPNLFELSYLTGREPRTLADAVEAARALSAMGPRVVLVTSVIAADAAADQIHMLAVSDEGSWLVTTPLLDRSFSGSGDVTAAAFLAQYLRTGSVPEALGWTASVVYGLLAATSARGGVELALVEAQDEFVRPSHSFEVRRLD